MEKLTKVIIKRYHSIEDISRENWLNAISALVMLGYEVYADEEQIVFTLGHDDEVKETDECDKCQGAGDL